MHARSSILRAGALSVLLAGSGIVVEAQITGGNNRQMRSSLASPCGAARCLHHIGYQDVGGHLSPVAGVSRPGPFRIPFTRGTPVFGTVSWGNDIARVELGERGDEPCAITVYGRNGTNRWEACGGGGPRSTRSAGFHGSPSPLIGIQICTNGRNNDRGLLIKGLKLKWSDRPHESAYADRAIFTDEVLQPNCSDWGQWVSCPVGMAAQTLVVHHQAIGGRRGAVGVQLECYPVDPVCYQASDPIWATYSSELYPCGDD